MDLQEKMRKRNYEKEQFYKAQLGSVSKVKYSYV